MQTHYRLTLDADVIGEPLPQELLYRLIVDTAVGKSSGIVRGALRSRVLVVGAKLIEVADLDRAQLPVKSKKRR